MESYSERDAAVADHDLLDGIPADVYARRWQTLAVLCASLIIVIVGNTVLNVALPTLQRDKAEGGLGASLTQVQWMVDAYGLVFAGLLYTAGAIGDRFGRKGALQGGLVLFAAGSLLGALAPSSGVLIVARGIMGIAAAFIMPSTLSILTNVFPGHERAKAIAIWAGISGSGAAIGPLASGLVLEHFWWGAVFLINLPIVALAFVAGIRLVPKSKDPHQTPLDPFGAVLSVGGLGSLVYAIIEGPRHGWLSASSVLWFGAAAVLLVGFWAWERRSEHPMLDLKLFNNPRFAVSAGGITLTFFAMFGSFFLLTQYLQGVLGYSPLGASVRLLPFSAVMMAVAPQTPKLVQRLGANVVGMLGLTFVGFGMIGIALLGVDTGYGQQLITWCVLATGMAMTMTPMTTQLMAAVPRNRAGMGSATNDTTRELGGALGVAVLGSLLTSRYTSGVHDVAAALPAKAKELVEGSIGGVRGLVASRQLPVAVGERLQSAANHAFVDGMRLAGIVAACVVAVNAFIVFKKLPNDRHREIAEVVPEALPEAVAGE
jgi:EmrB/QacA subfamily drug resistance transporter